MSTRIPKCLYVVPKGGLNDSLCQIARAVKYAKTHKRRLFVAAERDPHGEMRAPIETVLSLKNVAEAISNQELPPNIAGILRDNIDAPLPRGKNRNNAIVYSQAGGGLDSAKLLERCGIAESLSSHLTEVLKGLSDVKVGLHIRNTDYRTDWASAVRPILAGLAPKTKVLIATDDRSVVSSLAKQYGDLNFVTAQDFIDDWDSLNTRQVAFLELLCLASRQHLYVLPLQRFANSGQPLFSGYSRLAKAIWFLVRVKRDGLTLTLRSPSGVVGIAGDFEGAARVLFIAFLLLRHRRQIWFNPTGTYKQLNELLDEHLGQ